MRGALNANTFFNTVALARHNVRTLILVVEGEDDHFLVRRHINEADVLLIAGVGGRPRVLEAAELAERRGLRGIRFLIDADYDRFSAPTLRYPSNVIASKHHDAIVDLLVVSSALVDHVAETQSRSAIRRGVTVDFEQARVDAFSLASSVAPLRIANDRHGYGLRLAKFPFGELGTVHPSVSDLAALVVRRSGNTRNQSDIEADIAAELPHLGTDQMVLVGDHDFFRALARVLQLQGVASVNADALWDGVLAAASCPHLAGTGWYSELADWGAANSRSTFSCPCAA